MEYKKQLEAVMEYIRTNIQEKLSLERVSEMAGFSRFHFHRIFSAFTGETLHDFVRRVKMEKAVFLLRFSRDSITHIAMYLGYETPSSFLKAFRKTFGISPYQFRKLKKYNKGMKIEVNLLPVIPEEEKIMTETQLKPEIRTYPDMKAVLVRKQGKYSQSAGEAFTLLMEFAGPLGLFKKDSLIIGISYDDPQITPEEKLRYEAVVSLTPQDEEKVLKAKESAGEKFKDVEIKTVEGGEFAVFLHKGSYGKIAQTFKEIYSQWYPLSGVVLRDAPCWEIYLNDCCNTPEDELLTELCVPIKK